MRCGTAFVLQETLSCETTFMSFKLLKCVLANATKKPHDFKKQFHKKYLISTCNY